MLRPGQAVLVFALALSPCAVAAQEGTPIGQNRFSGPAGMLGGDTKAPASTKAVCDNTALHSIQRYTISYLFALTEYNTGTCAQIDTGKWTVTGQQKCKTKNCGTVTLGTVTGQHLANGDCPGQTYSFAAVCYTWNEHINWQITDEVDATWATSDGMFNEPLQLPVQVPIVYPTSETTAFSGWGDAGLGDWKQTLHADNEPKFDWSGSLVQETDPGPDVPASDTCWCDGSAIGQFYSISGGTWPNTVDMYKWPTWGPDHVGWCAAHGKFFCTNAAFPVPVQYYRMKKRAPCGTTFPQQMQYQAMAVGGPWQNYGNVNTLGGNFDYKNVTSLRAGDSKTHSASPVPAQTRVAVCPVPFIRTQVTPATAASGASIVVSASRPVAAAIDEIEKVSGRPITYEDPPFANEFHMRPMTLGAGDDPSQLVPRGGTLRFTLPATASTAQAVAAVQSMVGSYNASQGAATFSVSQDGLTHVVPQQTMDVSGQLASVTPILDARITLEKKPRSAAVLLDEITVAVSLATGQPVGIGTVPTNALYAQQIEIGADNEPAREVLEKLIVANGRPLSWRLLYDPGLKGYYLNIPLVKRLSGQP